MAGQEGPDPGFIAKENGKGKGERRKEKRKKRNDNET